MITVLCWFLVGAAVFIVWSGVYACYQNALKQAKYDGMMEEIDDRVKREQKKLDSDYKYASDLAEKQFKQKTTDSIEKMDSEIFEIDLRLSLIESKYKTVKPKK